MTKKEARKKFRYLRDLLSEDLIQLASHSICEQLTEVDLTDKTVHVFLPIKRLKEIDLWEFIHHCYIERVTVCTSVSNFDNHSMKTILLTPETELKENEWGILEPTNGRELSAKDIDLIILPLLYADEDGNRVGYGKGFYDRFLAQCRTDVKKIGVNYFAHKDSIEDTEPTDLKIDVLVFAK
ncbi:MAG: 5-formyltetrahydrofolate cyclo-ligase [Flavobacteriales bacterium]